MNGKAERGGHEIVIAGREIKWAGDTISYEQIVEEWNKLDPSRQVQGQPGIDWKYETGESGILYPGEEIEKVSDGLIVTIDPAHLS